MIDGIEHIELDGWYPSGAGSRPTNVYLLRGEQPALVGSGHPTNARALTTALRKLGCEPSSIHRILAASWSVTSLGATASFVHADVFVPSSDFVRPRKWNEWLDARRAALLELASELVETVDDWDRSDFDAYFNRKFPTVTNHLDFVPVRPGQVVEVAGRRLEVIAAPGPHADHVMYWDAADKVLFGGDFTTFGVPIEVQHVEDYLVSLERALDLEPKWLLPSHGEPSPRGVWSLKRMLRFAENFLSSLPTTLKQPKTLRDYVLDDLGHIPEDPVELLEAMRDRRSFLEELTGAGRVLATGEGVRRTYTDL